MTEARNRTACMMRIKNEEKFIRRSLERTWQVASRVMILDDGSTDSTELLALGSVQGGWDVGGPPGARVERNGSCELHYIRSPFANDQVRPEERVHELRDKAFLWDYCRANVRFDHVLCLDGDEWLSLEAIRAWPAIIAALDERVDVVRLPFVYLWDREDQQRIDGIYGPTVDSNGACLSCVTSGLYGQASNRADALAAAFACANPNHKRLHFPRAFTVARLSPQELFHVRFASKGTRGGFHVGSIPTEGFFPNGRAPVEALAQAPVVHAGYLDDAQRRAKHAWYNAIDPGNMVEGEYAHVIGEPNVHAPGPVKLAPWEDK